MNYIPLILMKLRELREHSPDLSFGDIMYSMLRPAHLVSKPEDAKIAWLREIDDFDFFNAITSLLAEEQEFKIEQKYSDVETTA